MVVETAAWWKPRRVSAKRPRRWERTSWIEGNGMQMCIRDSPYTSTYGTRAILTFKRTLDWMSGEADFAEVDLPLTDPKK